MRKIILTLLLLICSALPVRAQSNDEYEKFISYLDLSLPQLSAVKEYADAGDYESASKEFLDYYSNRKTPVWSEMPRTPGNNKNYNTTEADNAKNLLFELNGKMVSLDNGDGTVNWTYMMDTQYEWIIHKNRQFHFVTLSRAYIYTGDISYALALEHQFNNWYESNPMPSGYDANGIWSTLSAGIRIGSAMISYFNNIVMCDEVADLTKVRMLISLHEHGEYLSKYCGTNNWLILEQNGFYSLVYMFPEFKTSDEWKTIISGRIERDFSAQFLADGWQHELTPNYHIETIRGIHSLKARMESNGDNFPSSVNLLKSCIASQAIMGAGLFVLPLNDTHDVMQSDLMYRGADLSQNSDSELTGGFIASATGGFYGDYALTPGSGFYENSGYIVMRDKKDKNALSAFFEAGASGIGGHGWMYRDKLQFTLTAFDRDLLIDSGGSTTYITDGSDPLSSYSYTTPAHNTVTIDGYDQIRRSNNEFKPHTEAKFITSDSLEYAQSVYDEKYDEIKLIDVVHKRKIAFVKSEYFVVRDELSGKGEHTARQYWNFAPGKYVIDETTGIVRTDFDDGKNVIVIPVEFSGMEKSFGSESPMRGWTSTGEKLLNFCYKKTFTDSARMETVIIPYEGKIAPDVSVVSENGKIKIEYKNYTDILTYENDSVSVERTYDNGETQIIDFDSENGEQNKRNYRIIPCNGNIQAEWSGFENTGEYLFDDFAKGKSFVRLSDDMYQMLRVRYGLSSITITAKGYGTLNVGGKTLEINSDTYSEYNVYGLKGGNIKVMCTDGDVDVDMYTFKGHGESINMHAIRRRMPQKGILEFVQNSDELKTASVNITPISSLSPEDNAYFGFKWGNYEIRYSTNKNQMEIYLNDVIVKATPMFLSFGKTYNFLAEVSDGMLIFKIDNTEVLSTEYKSLADTTGIIASAVDLYVDNIYANNVYESYESKYISYGSANWYVEGIDGQYAEMEVISDAEIVFPGTQVTIQLNNANGATLIKNGKEVAFSGNEYTFTANQGIYTFCLKKDDRISAPVKIRAEDKFCLSSTYLTEPFNSATLNNSWRYNTDYFVHQDNAWYLKGVSSAQTEAYTEISKKAGRVSLEAEFVPDTNLSKVKLFLCRSTVSGQEFQPIQLDVGGTISDIITGEKIGEYTPRIVNRIRLDVDLDAQTYDVYNNGVLLSAGRKIQSELTNLWRIYPMVIYRGVSGISVSNLKISALADYPIQVNAVKKAGQTEIFSQRLNFMDGDIYSAVYDKGCLSSVNVLANNSTVTVKDAPVNIFNWHDMIPYAGKAETYFSLTPAYNEENFFYEDFNDYTGGTPASRWGISGTLTAENGAMVINADPAGAVNAYYNCLELLENKVSIQADITVTGNASDVKLFYFRDNLPNAELGINTGETMLITCKKDGKIYSDKGELLGVYTQGEKNTIRVEIDQNNKVFALWVNNVLLKDNIPLIGTATGVRRIYLASIWKGSSNIIMDNFIVSKLR